MAKWWLALLTANAGGSPAQKSPAMLEPMVGILFLGSVFPLMGVIPLIQDLDDDTTSLYWQHKLFLRSPSQSIIDLTPRLKTPPMFRAGGGVMCWAVSCN